MASITARVSKSLKGLNFPADKEKCIDYARHHQAPDDVIDVLERMPDGKFDSMAGVWQAVGKTH